MIFQSTEHWWIYIGTTAGRSHAKAYRGIGGVRVWHTHTHTHSVIAALTHCLYGVLYTMFFSHTVTHIQTFLHPTQRRFTPCSSSSRTSVHLVSGMFACAYTSQDLVSSWIAFVYLVWRLPLTLLSLALFMFFGERVCLRHAGLVAKKQMSKTSAAFKGAEHFQACINSLVLSLKFYRLHDE